MLTARYERGGRRPSDAIAFCNCTLFCSNAVDVGRDVLRPHQSRVCASTAPVPASDWTGASLRTSAVIFRAQIVQRARSHHKGPNTEVTALLIEFVWIPRRSVAEDANRR